MNALIKNSIIVTQNENRDIVEGDIYIEDGVVKEIGKINTEAEYVIRDKIVMPGLINTHTHLPMTLLRGYGDDLPLEEWLTKKIWPIEARLKEKHVRAGTKLAFLEMVSTGTTCCCDMYFFEEAIAEEAKKFGIRCYAGFSIIDFDTPEMKMERLLPECEKFIRKWREDEIVKPVIAPHSTYTCSPETLEKSRELAERYNTLIHIHCSETRKEVYDVLNRYGLRPLYQIKKYGLLTDKTILAHCGWITKEEVREIARAGACVSHNPVSNMKLATGGYTPLPELFREGAVVALGTDGAASNNKLDMFETMKFSALVHKHHRWDASVVNAQEVLDMATINPAKFLGLNASIEEGKKVDLITIDANSPNLLPLHNVISHLVYAVNGCNVSDVIINGRMIMHNKEFEVDKEKIFEEVERAKEEILS